MDRWSSCTESLIILLRYQHALQSVGASRTRGRNHRYLVPYWSVDAYKFAFFPSGIRLQNSLVLLLLTSCLLTSCLTTIKNHVIKYNMIYLPSLEVYERSGKNLFWSIKNSCEVLNKLKSRGFRASSLSTYDFSTLYTTLPHNLIKDKTSGFN